jgi:DNA-binding GntR family transcriptional regulator
MASSALIQLDERPATLTDIAFARIREAIVTRELEPGARVTEAGIAKQLAISKTPVREAMVRLREVGLIEPGNRVVRQSDDTVRHAYELREVLETFTARTAAARAGADARRAIVDAAARTLAGARAGDINAFRAADVVFHEAIAEAAGNPRVRNAIENAMALVRALSERDRAATHVFIDLAESHVAIADAIARGDGDSAARGMAEHIRLVEQHMREIPPQPGA